MPSFQTQEMTGINQFETKLILVQETSRQLIGSRLESRIRIDNQPIPTVYDSCDPTIWACVRSLYRTVMIEAHPKSWCLSADTHLQVSAPAHPCTNAVVVSGNRPPYTQTTPTLRRSGSLSSSPGI